MNSANLAKDINIFPEIMSLQVILPTHLIFRDLEVDGVKILFMQSLPTHSSY